MGLFVNLSEILNSINHNKENVLRSRDEREERSYAPFIINKSLSYFADTIFLSNHMNVIPNVDKRMHYEYFLHAVRKRKRFSKWQKKQNDPKVSWIMEYYDISRRKAEEYMSILSENELEIIRDRTSFGEKNH